MSPMGCIIIMYLGSPTKIQIFHQNKPFNANYSVECAGNCNCFPWCTRWPSEKSGMETWTTCVAPWHSWGEKTVENRAKKYKLNINTPLNKINKIIEIISINASARHTGGEKHGRRHGANKHALNII
jgi:hypothetical protein